MKKQIVYAVLGTFMLVQATWLWAEQDEKPVEKREPQANKVQKKADQMPANSFVPPSSTNSTGRNLYYANPSRYGSPATIRNNENPPMLPGNFSYQGESSPRVVDMNGGAFLNTVNSFGSPIDNNRPFVTGVPMQPHIYQATSPMTAEAIERNTAFQSAVTQLRAAGTDEDKVSAREKLSTMVSEQLDADLDRREEELAAIEKRIKELRKQLDDRRAAKPEMLKMLVMLIDNPQMGLGIPAEWMQMLMNNPSPYPTYSAANATYSNPTSVQVFPNVPVPTPSY